jgi:hypothetical protein
MRSGSARLDGSEALAGVARRRLNRRTSSARAPVTEEARRAGYFTL